MAWIVTTAAWQQGGPKVHCLHLLNLLSMPGGCHDLKPAPPAIPLRQVRMQAQGKLPPGTPPKYPSGAP